MAQLVVRNLEEDVKARLRVLAAEHGHSMEEEVRAILRQAVEERPRLPGLGTRIAARFAHSGLRDDEPIPELRGENVRPVQFD
ncbi:MAG: plasmid stabilization protein [Rhodopila sp.]|nr:plasmid stabilization protein [Rhodopila sp.]